MTAKVIIFCVHVCAGYTVCVCVSEPGTERGGEVVQTGVLREDTRGRVSARLCRLALTATDAGLK